MRRHRGNNIGLGEIPMQKIFVVKKVWVFNEDRKIKLPQETGGHRWCVVID